MPSLFDGIDPIINEWFGLNELAPPLNYKNGNAYNHLVQEAPQDLDAGELIGAVLEQMAANWQNAPPHRPSPANWRFEKQPYFRQTNKSPEVTLEKSIAIITKGNWANQVPTCSGVVGAGEKKRSIDLVCRHGPTTYSFIELKVNSNHPIFAAMEILGYGLAYTFWRQHLQELQELGYPNEQRELLEAENIILEVLAPHAYYHGDNLLWLSDAINGGLAAFFGAADLGFTITFQFREFPPGFYWFPWNGPLIEALDNRQEPIVEE